MINGHRPRDRHDEAGQARSTVTRVTKTSYRRRRHRRRRFAHRARIVQARGRVRGLPWEAAGPVCVCVCVCRAMNDSEISGHSSAGLSFLDRSLAAVVAVAAVAAVAWC